MKDEHKVNKVDMVEEYVIRRRKLKLKASSGKNQVWSAGTKCVHCRKVDLRYEKQCLKCGKCNHLEI